MNEEIMNKAIELTDEEAQGATGGTADIVSLTCPKCGYKFKVNIDGKCKLPPCPKCGFDDIPDAGILHH